MLKVSVEGTVSKPNIVIRIDDELADALAKHLEGRSVSDAGKSRLRYFHEELRLTLNEHFYGKLPERQEEDGIPGPAYSKVKNDPMVDYDAE